MDEVEHDAGVAVTPVAVRRREPAGLGLREHALFAVLLSAGIVVRLAMAVSLQPVLERPDAGTAAADVVVDLQHLAGLLAACGGYAVAVRWGVWRWLAAAAAAPALLDGRVLAGEQVVGTAPLVGLLVSATLVALCWRARPAPVHLVVAGLCAIGAGVLLAFADPLGRLPSPAARVDALAGTVRDLLVLTVPGLLLVAGAALAVGAGLGLARARASRMRVVSALVVGLPLLVALGLLARIPATWADALAVICWWPLAAALGLTALLRGRRGHDALRAQRDEVDLAAAADFTERYDRPSLAPVTIVIAAYNEADGLPGVLAGMPETVCGLAAHVLVVDDGSTDGTAAAVGGSRAFVVACPVNRGQGAALRLGYQLALAHGASYVITTDADGQYDVGDLPAVLTPILEGRADFVTGSRILGRQHTHDRVRRLGVHVFAWIASAFAGRRLTDTSFGLRAMRAEVPAAVTLNQPQYQSSELLLGVLSHGFEVVEVPATMHVRAAGASKKGRNLVYGARYARVVVGTWWREGCLTPAPEGAAALGGDRGHAARQP